jgi:phage tail sheath gpL-like
MATLTLTIKTPSADAKEYAAAGSPHRCLNNAANLIKAIASGSTETSQVTVQRSDDSPVAASGVFTLTSAIATDAITIGTITMVATSTPTLTTHWEIDGASDTLDAASLAAAINANPTLSKVVVATSSGSAVTVTALQKGVVGNQIPISSADATIVITDSEAFLVGGAGGSDSTLTVYRG